MWVCPDCGEENSDRYVYCIGCGQRAVEDGPVEPGVALPGPRPSGWRRKVTASIAGISLIVGWGGLLSASAEDAQCEAEGGWLCGMATFGWLVFLTVPLTVIAVLFGLAAKMPFGTFRRVIIGIGSGLLAIPATFLLLWWLGVIEFANSEREADAGFAWLAMLGAFCLTLVGSYRLAR